MNNHKIQFVGNPCGQHGTYTFYKAFKYALHGKQKILALGEFFFLKIWEEEDIISIGETQLLWEDRSSGQILVSLRLYFMPENTPDGRTDSHGEHEVVSLAEKVVLRAEDVINIMRAAGGVKWDTGLKGVYGPEAVTTDDGQITPNSHLYGSAMIQTLDIKEVIREKQLIGDVIEPSSLHVIVLSYDKYCRIRGLLKRLEGMEEDYMKTKIVVALGGFLVPSKRTKLLFCRDVFEYPELEGHELLCNHLAPKLQGRPRKKHKTKHKDSDSDSSEESPQVEEIKEIKTVRPKGKHGLLSKPNSLRGMDRKTNNSSNNQSGPHLPKVSSSQQKLLEYATPAMNKLIEVDFMSKLHNFMKERKTPMNTRIPHIGLKVLNVFELFTRVQQKGGYEAINQRKLWKQIYEDMNGPKPTTNNSRFSISNPNVLKRHYENLLLPYEKYLLQEQERIFNLKNSKIKQELKDSNSILPAFNYNNKKGVDNNKPNTAKSPLTPKTPKAPLIPLNRGTTPTPTSRSTTPVMKLPHSSAAAVSNRTPPPELLTPKSEGKKEHIPPDLAKRPEITITPIPRSLANAGHENLLSSLPISIQSSLASCLPGGINALASLQETVPGLKVEDLVSSLGAVFKNYPSMSGGMSALQDLAKYADKYDKFCSEPAPKKMKTEEPPSLINGLNQRHSGNGELKMPHKSGLPVPGLVSADIFRSMNMLDGNNLLLPAHQSNKNTINTLAALLPVQTSIYPATAPAAHQQNKQNPKAQPNNSRLEPPRLHQQSVYSQSKNIYGKPNSLLVEPFPKEERRSSPEIEILDLSTPSKSTRPDIELLDLSTRKDLTVSAVLPRPSTSSNRNSSSSKNHHPQIGLKSELRRNSYSNSLGTPTSTKKDLSKSLNSSLSTAGLNPLGGLGHPLSPYMLPPHPSLKPGGPPGGLNFMSPFVDPNNLAAYYSLLASGLMPPTSSAALTGGNPLAGGSLGGSPLGGNSGLGGSAAMAAAAQQVSLQNLAQLNSLGLNPMPNITPDALATNLGIYKNFLPQINLPAPHFLSDLISQNGQNPPSSK